MGRDRRDRPAAPALRSSTCPPAMNRPLQPRRPVRAPGLHGAGRLPPRGDLASAVPFPEARDAPRQRDASTLSVRCTRPTLAATSRSDARRLPGPSGPGCALPFLPRRGATSDLGRGRDARRAEASPRLPMNRAQTPIPDPPPTPTPTPNLTPPSLHRSVSWSQYVSGSRKNSLPMNRLLQPRRPVRAPGLHAVGRVPPRGDLASAVHGHNTCPEFGRPSFP